MAVVDEPFHDLGLGGGDFLEVLEVAEMGGGDRGDDSHMRAHHLDQRPDLVGVVHADLEDAEIGIFRHARQGQRHAPVIVERRDGGMHPAGWRQHVTQHLLGGRLADRAGDGDDPGGAAVARSTPSRTIASSTSSTTIIGAISRPSAGSLASLTTRSAAPLAIAIPA